VNRAIRPLSWLVLACLLAIGPAGDTQVPSGPPVPDVYLQTSEDAGSFLCILTAVQGMWERHLASGSPVASIRFKPLISAGRSTIYRASAYSPASAPLPFPPRSAPPPSGTFETFTLLHAAGTPASIPPDLLFTASVAASGGPGSGLSLSKVEQLEFLRFILEGLADPMATGPIAPLAQWLDSSDEVSVESISVKSTGAECLATLVFRDSTGGSPAWIAWSVRAKHSSSGFTQVTVR